MKILRRALFYATLLLAAIFIALTASLVLYKDRIINEFIRQANRQLSTPVTIGKMDVSLMDQFPRLSIVFRDVYVEDSHPGRYPLLTAGKISLQLDPIEVWRGNYTVRGMVMEDCEANLKIDDNGLNNYRIVKKSGASSGNPVRFQLSDVSLRNTTVHYVDLRLLQDFTFTSTDLLASLHSDGDLYQIDATGDVTSDRMAIRENDYFRGKTFKIESHLLYDDAEKILTIHSSTLALKSSEFSVSGTYAWKSENKIDLTTKGRNTDIQTLLSLLPEAKAQKFEKYRSKGNVYFAAHLRGPLSSVAGPALSVDFGFDKATLYHPEYATRIEQATLSGRFLSSDVRDPAKSSLTLNNITGKLNKEDFRANFEMRNFNDPFVVLDFKGKIDAPALLDFYPVKKVKYASGALNVDVAFKGRINLLKNKATAQRVSTLGTVDMQHINILLGEHRIPLENLNGNLQFSNNDLALSNVSGKLGRSDFVLNGFFKNIITFLLFENQPIGIETDLKSNFIDLDELFALGFGDASDGEKDDRYTFSLSRNVNLNFNCNVKSLRYKRFRGQNIVGDLLVKDQMAVSRNLSLKTMGGGLKLSGIVDAKNNKAIDVVSTLKLNGIDIDSIFYVFENFHQTFIQDKHLKGKATADVNLEMTLNQNLRLFQETLIADIGIAIRHGELNNFEPLRKLDRYLGDEGLDRLRFSELKNEIHIENKTIYLPQMEVRSNVTNISISGTHTFDQRIDYRVVAPLRHRRAEAVAAGATKDDAHGNTRLFLKITGTTDNYRIAYDTKAVRKKIANDLAKEVKELKDAFKSRGKMKEKELELSRDEYFDW